MSAGKNTPPTILYIGPSYDKKEHNARYVDIVDPSNVQQIPVEYQDPSSIALLAKYFGPPPGDRRPLTPDEKQELKTIIQRRIDTLKTTFRIFPPNSLKNISYGTKIQKMETLLDEIENNRQLAPEPSAAQQAASAAAERVAGAAGAAAGAVAGAAGAAAGAVAGAAGAVGRALLPRLPAAELIDNTFHAAYILLQRGDEDNLTLADMDAGWEQVQETVRGKTLGDVIETILAGRANPAALDRLEQAYIVFRIQEQLGVNRTGDAPTLLKEGFTSTFSRLFTEIVAIPANQDISGQIESLYNPPRTDLPTATALSTLLKNLLQNPNTQVPEPLRTILNAASPVVPAVPAGAAPTAPPPEPLSPQEKAVFLTSAVLIKQYIAENPV